MKIMEGNKAVVLGALKAGVKFYAGYPITPSSEILEEWSKLAETDKNLKFLQSEDEIAAVHAIIGASLAGSKSFTATSGPGFSLMQEGIGLGFSMQAPIVVVNSQRQGPSTGMPTMPAQGDMLQTQYGSHGDYKTFVLYPNSAQECFEYTIKAFNIAQEIQSPTILLMDAYISHLEENVDLDTPCEIVEMKNIPLTQSNEHRFYSGFTTGDNQVKSKDPKAFMQWIHQRLDKFDTVALKHRYFEYYGRQDAENLIVAFGIVSRFVYDIIDKYPDRFALFRPITVYPVLENELALTAKDKKRVFTIEMNYGQYDLSVRAALLRETIKVPVGEGGDLRLADIETKLLSQLK